jgi:hypothetical protein
LDYRLYFLEGGHFRRVVDLECAGDADAISQVPEHADGRSMELWHRGRLVKRFSAAGDPLPAPSTRA